MEIHGISINYEGNSSATKLDWYLSSFFLLCVLAMQSDIPRSQIYTAHEWWWYSNIRVNAYNRTKKMTIIVIKQNDVRNHFVWSVKYSSSMSDPGGHCFSCKTRIQFKRKAMSTEVQMKDTYVQQASRSSQAIREGTESRPRFYSTLE